MRVRKPQSRQQWLGITGAIMVAASEALEPGQVGRPGGKPAFWVGFVLFWVGLALIWPYAIKFLRWEGEGTGLKVIFLVLLCAFILVSFIPTVVFVASGGNTAIFSAVTALGESTSIRPELEGIPVDLIPVLLVGGPELLRARLAFEDATALTRRLVLGWLAAGAVVLTCSYLFLLRFFSGPLATLNIGALLAAALAVAVLLTPLYQSIAQACWRRGIIDILDPAKWAETRQQVTSEIAKGSSSHSAQAKKLAVDAVAPDPITNEHDLATNEGSGQTIPGP
jgi:hypothetical protein